MNAVNEIQTGARNYYNALQTVPAWVAELVDEVERAGAWETGIESDKKQRGVAINCDVYSYCDDHKLAVVQVRECVFHPRRWNRVRKNYFLIGRNENGNVFAHAVSSVARAVKTVDQGVVKALCEIWSTTPATLKKIVRSGDTAFVPYPCILDSFERIGKYKGIGDSHFLLADEAYKDTRGNIYVVGNAEIYHVKQQHSPAVVNQKGKVWRVMLGNRASTWNFSIEHGD